MGTLVIEGIVLLMVSVAVVTGALKCRQWV